MERYPLVPLLGNLALDGAHSALHQVGLLTTLAPKTGLQVLPPSRVPLDLCYFCFPSFFLPFPAILSTPSLYMPICVPFLGFVPRPQGEEECPACCSCPNLPFALLLHSAVAPSGLRVPACPGPAFPGLLATLPLPASWPWASTSLSSPLEWGAPLGDYCPSTPIQPIPA